MADPGEQTGSLPFGRTSVTTAELRRLSDVEATITALSDHGVHNPESRVDQYFDVLPELLAWLETEGRIFPWRLTRDPWKVYIAEILLQRTRANAVANVYVPFFTRFPGPEAIRRSDPEEIRKIVDPLGFGNQRTRTLADVARILGEDHNDRVPESLEELQRPWRVGAYSARATLLFAFDHPFALVDANIARVTQRVFGYEMPDQPHKSDRLYQFLDALMPSDPSVCRAVNLAYLDLGDGVCVASSPKCDLCPLASGCQYQLSNAAPGNE